MNITLFVLLQTLEVEKKIHPVSVLGDLTLIKLFPINSLDHSRVHFINIYANKLIDIMILFKETKSATMNIFRFFLFSF